MDGQTNNNTIKQMNAWRNIQMSEWASEIPFINGLINEQNGELMDKWINKQINVCIYQWIHEGTGKPTFMTSLGFTFGLSSIHRYKAWFFPWEYTCKTVVYV